jgi:hypothetical protein
VTDVPQITIERAIRQIMAEMDGPVPIDEFIGRVLTIRPSTARGRKASIRNVLRWSAFRTWVQTDPKTIAPIRTILDGVRFRLEHEPASQRRYQEIDRKNRELADLLFSRLEAAPNEYMDTHDAIAWAYGHMSDPRGYPGDHWTAVLARDKRTNWDGFQIRYPEDRTAMQVIMGGSVWKPAEARFTPAQGRQVYCFKASLTHQPKLWRRIEIQGAQTLAHFDDILRDAFNCDPVGGLPTV